MTNTKKPTLLEGKSLTPILAGEKVKLRSNMIYAYKSNQRALRKGDYKLIKYMVNGQQENQLFNLQTDPWEIDNLYNEPAHQTLVTEMNQEIQTELTSWGDKAILSKEDWGIPIIPRWIDQVSPKTIEWLRGLAERERGLRGFEKK